MTAGHMERLPPEGPAQQPADRRRYRSVIGHFATGVTVVTGLGPEGPVGMTANAVCSLSLEPLLVLVCFDNGARTLPVVREVGRFGVNVLRADQHELSGVFASKRGELEKFAGIAHRIEDRVPVIEGVLAWLACDLQDLYPGGDHTIGVGAVTSMHHDGEGDPLVWFRGSYTTVARDVKWERRPGEAAPGP
jgi:3-hydroxy-9,10-secoandrosta-1,3,5(10)-triene-9,17-dione monooxygenase reductase component